jgi:hypothetical protein
MQEKVILQPKKTKKYEIIDADGVSTGEYIEFDFEMIEYPLLLQKANDMHYKNKEWIRNQFVAIDRQKDYTKKGKFLSNNEELKIKAVSEYCDKEEKVIDIIFGVGTTKKMLNGRKKYYEMYDDIMESLDKIMPSVNNYVDGITEDIKRKYSSKKNVGVLSED